MLLDTTIILCTVVLSNYRYDTFLVSELTYFSLQAKDAIKLGVKFLSTEQPFWVMSLLFIEPMIAYIIQCDSEFGILSYYIIAMDVYSSEIWLLQLDLGLGRSSLQRQNIRPAMKKGLSSLTKHHCNLQSQIYFLNCFEVQILCLHKTSWGTILF